MKDQLKIFQTNLEDFAKKYKKDINKNPEFRKYFQDMCTKIGVDPLACKYNLRWEKKQNIYMPILLY